MDEGNIYEALIEGSKHGLRNCWWIVDYNRQSLDSVVREGLRREPEDFRQLRLGRGDPENTEPCSGPLLPSQVARGCATDRP